MKALLDGDIYSFRSAAASENEDLGIAIYRMEEMIDNTLVAVGADEFSMFLSGSNNFRYQVYPEYKANRKAEKPRHLADLKEYLVKKYNAQVSDGCEADDLLGIAQCGATIDHWQGTTEWPTIICSLDKDLRQIPGKHYSFEIKGTSSLGKEWVKPAELLTVTPEEGLKFFYYQMLVGDAADNIKGVSGIGPVKAKNLLAEATTEQELFEIVSYMYSSDEHMLMTGQCLHIFQKENDIWQFPKFGS